MKVQVADLQRREDLIVDDDNGGVQRKNPLKILLSFVVLAAGLSIVKSSAYGITRSAFNLSPASLFASIFDDIFKPIFDVLAVTPPTPKEVGTNEVNNDSNGVGLEYCPDYYSVLHSISNFHLLAVLMEDEMDFGLH